MRDKVLKEGMQGNISVVILAAGLGVRMKSKLAKVLHRAGGLPLVEQVVRAASSIAARDRITVVVGHQAERVRAALSHKGVAFVEQTEQRGTGHALMVCRDQLADRGGLLIVLYGDTPLLSAATLRALVARHHESQAAATVIAMRLNDPAGYGRLIVGEAGYVHQIVEHKAATTEQLAIDLVNSGIYCFDAELLWRHIDELRPNNAANEYYLTDLVEILRNAGERVAPLIAEDASELLGINTRVELASADRILRGRKTRDLMLAGVTIEKPETVTIDADVTIGMDSVVEPFARILGQTIIGQDCRVGACSIVEDCELGDRVEIAPLTMLAHSAIDSDARVGPFARLRMENHVEAGARIGNFVELKKTRLGAGAKANHLAYLGDAEIGAGANIGAGTITCNYDGERKHRTSIGEGAFIGSNATLVAPIEVGDRGYVGAGSVITDAVPPDALALGRARQVVKEGWVRKRKKK
jgi:bifunctional UDP-N-acetylglucosamine pyrophosphorylase/glucosamine-1-phosphate N-acetyltransferase